MKLCFIANARLNHTWRWIRPLMERGHTIQLISYTPVSGDPPGLQMVDLTRLNNTPRVRFGIWAAWLRGFLRKERPDILHVHQVQAAGWLGWLAGYHPLVISAWGSDLLQEPHRNALRGWLVRRALGACDRMIAPSTVLKAAAIELGLPAERIIMIPWGIDAQAFAPQPDDHLATRRSLGLGPDAAVLLCPRSPAPLYHLREVLLAFSRLASRWDKLHLVLIEYNPDLSYLASLKSLTDEIGLGERVHWLPSQPEAEAMARLYRAADVMVSVPESEGYGLSVYEAMACGCPCVISDLPVFRNILRDGQEALKVPVGDVQALASALDRLLDNRELRRDLAVAGRRLAAGMTNRQMAGQAERLYAELK